MVDDGPGGTLGTAQVADATGTRDIQGEKASKGIKENSFKFDSNKSQSGKSISFLIKGATCASIDPNYSTFVPDFNFLIEAIARGFDQLTERRKAKVLNEAIFIPDLWYLYTLLGFYKISKCMREVGIRTRWVQNLHDAFEDLFGDEDLPIPGFLVPFFETLVVSHDQNGFATTPIIPVFPGIENLGDVDDPVRTGALANPFLIIKFPNLAALFRGFQHLTAGRPYGTNPTSGGNAPGGAGGIPVPPLDESLNWTGRWVQLTNCRHSFKHMNNAAVGANAANTLRYWQLKIKPAVVADNWNPPGWWNYLNVDNNMRYISHQLAKLSIFCGYFSNSKNFGGIEILGSGAGGIVQTNIDDPAAAPNDYDQVVYQGVAEMSMKCTGIEWELPAAVFINSNIPENYSGAEQAIMDRDLNGPVWDEQIKFNSTILRSTQYLESYVGSFINVAD